MTSEERNIIEKLRLQVEQLEKALSEKDARISSLEQILYKLRHQMYGKKSEKNLPTDPNALMPSLFGDELSEQEKKEIEKEAQKEEEKLTKTITVTVSKRKKINSIDTSKLEVVVDENIIEPENIDKDKYVRWGEETSDELVYEPSKIYIKRTVRAKYVLKSSIQIQDPEKQVFIVAPQPIRPLAKCIASSSLLAEIVIQKFIYHLPFYRVIQKFKESDFIISDSTIGDWYAATCVKLKPLYDLLKTKVLSCDYIQVDESTLPVIDNEKKRAVKGYVWVVRNAITGEVFFYYKNGARTHDAAKILLKGYKGAIQSDGYSAYDQFEKMPGILSLGCMAHARRKFTEALKQDSKRASEGLMMIGKLYEIEKRAIEEGLSTDDITKLRKEEAYPIICLFEKWLIDNYLQVLKDSLIGNAIKYTYSLLPRLSRYVLDGRYKIDNNLIENAIRPLAIGRKNYLFCGSAGSAERASMMYSFISSCKAAGIDSREWFTYVLDNIHRYDAKSDELSELLPSNFKNKQLVTQHDQT